MEMILSVLRRESLKILVLFFVTLPIYPLKYPVYLILTNLNGRICIFNAISDECQKVKVVRWL